MVDHDANAALRARFDDVYSRYARMRDGMGELRQRLAELEVTATSPDRTVTAVLGPQGQLRRLQLTERAYQHQPDRLAAIITETVAKAQHATAAAVRELMGAVMPDEAGLADALRSGDFTALLHRHDENLGYTEPERRHA